MTVAELEKDFSSEEQSLLNDVVRALRTMQYGSVLLTVHEGRLVELQKTERIRRKNTPKE